MFNHSWQLPWYNEGCSELLDQRKQAKLQWLQDPSKINGDNLNNVKREASRYFRNEKREYLKDKIRTQVSVETSWSVKEAVSRVLVLGSVAAEYGSMEQLEVLYGVRVREVQQLAHQMEELREQAAHEKDQMYRRLALAQAEKERAALQYAQSAQNLGK
jgi:phosphopantetheinyl transferase (holo-ACP synthase)